MSLPVEVMGMVWGWSQNGAKHLAENGLGWRDILQIFYQNITIENLQEY